MCAAGLHDPLEKCLSLARTWAIAKRGTKTADHVIEPDAGFHHMAPRGDDAAHPMRCWGFDVHLLVKAGACQLGEPGGIMWICLVRLQCL